MRGFSGFDQVLKSDLREKPLGQSAISLMVPSQLQPRLYQNIHRHSCRPTADEASRHTREPRVD